MGIDMVLTVIFIVLKLVGVIDWSWWWVWSPLWISFLLYFIISYLAKPDDLTRNHHDYWWEK